MGKIWLNFDCAIMRNKIVLIFILIGFGLFVMYQYITAIAFEPERWRQSAQIFDGNTRSKMATDLISRNLLVGKTRDEVQKILGKPEYEERQNKISYKLKEEFWIIDPVSIEWLDVIFNRENKVEKAEIRFQKIG